MWARPRETSELFPIDVQVDLGGALTPVEAFEVAVVPTGTPRPVPESAFRPADEVNGRRGYWIENFAPGEYLAYVRVGSRVFAPLYFRIT